MKMGMRLNCKMIYLCGLLFLLYTLIEPSSDMIGLIQRDIKGTFFYNLCHVKLPVMRLQFLGQEMCEFYVPSIACE